MKELIAVINKYGLWTILVLILLILVGASVWLITYLNAEPGEKVSMFWGMIEYTKGKLQPEPRLRPEPEKSKLSGSITSPSSDNRVARWFKVEGTVSGQHRHLWLIVRIGQQHWPKEPKLRPQGGHWVGEVNEEGWPPGGRFEVLLVDVSDEVNRRFQEWLINGHRTKHYPGLTGENLGDANILDSKEYQLIIE